MIATEKREVVLGEKEYFKGIGPIQYEGKTSDNPMAFKYYDADRVVAGKTMRAHLKFAVAYWHTFCGTGLDPFGVGTKQLPWTAASDPLKAAYDKADAA
ncbi:MAG: xylose isomerase, partial [Bacteroidota bacterium]